MFERIRIRAPFELHRDRLPLPQPIGADYLVRVDVCGLCRSDLHAAADWARDWQEVGHEFGGTVVARGRWATRFRVGERVAVRNAASCGECERCRGGQPRRCAQLVVNMQGFRDFALCDERSLVDARGLDDEALALVEPINVALDLLHAARLRPAHRVLVLGAGTLGLLTAFLGRQVWALKTMFVAGRAAASPLAERLELPYVSFGEGVDAAAVRVALGGAADRVLVTSPPSTIGAALDCCRAGGRVLVAGLDDLARCAVAIDVSRLVFGQQTLTGVCAAPNEHFEQAVEVLRTHAPALRGLIARRVSRDRLEEALQTWRDRAHFDGKTILVNERNGREHAAA